MRQNYFVYNGKKYYTGTIIKAKVRDYVHEVIFYYEENGYYIFKDTIPYGNDGFSAPEKIFFQRLVEVTDKKDMRVIPIKKKRNELEIDWLFVGWLWYIFIMLVSSIFVGNVFCWILASIIFFTWRKNKINEEGYYYERQI